MNYAASLAYLNTFINHERTLLHSSRPWNLKRMRLLRKTSGFPDRSFFPVLIAGTKGKGSTGFFLESILTAAGIPNGFYSSPHLETPRERIRLNGKMVSEKIWLEGIREVQTVLKRCPKNEPFTYFEIMTLLAMLIFKRQRIQLGIFEVGMGGRLDATNVIDAQLCLITPVDLDHEAILGNTIAKIAAEKAAIIRPRSHAVISPQPPEASAVMRFYIKKQKAVYHAVQPLKGPAGLAGDYQQVNAGAALKAAQLLRDVFAYPLSPVSFNKGIQAAAWPGRFEVLKRSGRTLLLDAAHNPVSIEALVRNLQALYPKASRTVIFGTSKDKNSGEMLRTLSRYFDEIVLTRAASPRSAEIGTLLRQAQGLFARIYPAATVSGAISLAASLNRSLTVVTGSFFVLGEAKLLLSTKHQ